MSTPILGPHHTLPSNNPKERFILQLFDQLWEKYRSRVSRAQAEDFISTTGFLILLKEYLTHQNI